MPASVCVGRYLCDSICVYMKGLLAMMMGSGIGKHQHQQQQQQQRQRQQLNLNVTCTKQIRQRGGHRGGGGQTEYDIVSDTLSALSVYMTSTPSHTHTNTPMRDYKQHYIWPSPGKCTSEATQLIEQPIEQINELTKTFGWYFPSDRIVYTKIRLLKNQKSPK